MMLEAEVKKLLDDANRASASSAATNKGWTREIKSRLTKLGHEKKFWVGEWLYDLCWLRYDEEDYLRDVELALECEWLIGKEDIMDDFIKLCQCRATLRVMIYQTWTLEDSKRLTDTLKDQIKRCDSSVDGDRYLLSCWINGKGKGLKFHHECITHTCA